MRPPRNRCANITCLYARDLAGACATRPREATRLLTFTEN